MPYKIDPETCDIIESEDGVTLKSAGLLAFHLAGEKANYWSSRRAELWEIYQRAKEKSEVSDV